MFQTKSKSPPRNQSSRSANQIKNKTFIANSTQTVQDKAGETIIHLTFENDKLQDLLKKAQHVVIAQQNEIEAERSSNKDYLGHVTRERESTQKLLRLRNENELHL
jgi:hypothetical protein